MIELQSFDFPELLEHALPLSGSLSIDPQLPLTDVVANLFSGDELVTTASLSSLDSWNVEGGVYSVVLPLPQSLADGAYNLSLTASDGVRTAITESRTFNYRTPIPLSITLESPENGQIYYSPVGISGYVTADRTVNPIVRAYVQRLDGQANEVIELPLLIEGQWFGATIDEPGSYELTVEAVVNNTREAETVRFEYVSGNGVYMPLDEAINDELADLEGINNAGALIGSARERFAPGVVDQAVRFAAENYVQIADHIETDLDESDFSLFVWVKTSRSGMIQSLLEKRPTEVVSAPGYTLYLSRDGTPSFQMTTMVATGAISWSNFESPLDSLGSSFVADGLWHHVGITVERNVADGLKLYLDGRVVGEFDPTAHTSTLSNDVPLMLGHHVTWADSYLAGSMDELLIVKRALAAEEIQQLIERAAINLPQEGTVSLTSPTPGTYNGSVNIVGSYTTEPALTAVALEIIDEAETPIPISVEIDPNTAAGEFNIAADCRIFSPGSHTIQARLTDSLEQTLLSQPVSFDFRLPEPKVELEMASNDSSGVYFYGRADFSGCPLPEGQAPQISVSVNERLIDVDVVNGQLPGDFVFGVSAQWLQAGENVIQVDVIDPRDSETVGSARIGVAIESPLALTIVNPIVGATLTGHVQVYGYFSNARGPMTLYSELDGKAFIENIPVNDNQTFTFTIPAELLQATDYHGLYLRALDQGTQQQTETKTEFFYKPGSELTPGGDVLVLNDMDALWREENRPWFLNWVNFDPGFDSGRKNSVQFVVSEATCKLVDGIDGHCARAKVVLSELYQENGYELSIIERAALAEIPDHIKVLVLFLPDSEFNEKGILAIKKFAASGGRVVYVGESYSCPECYSEAVQAQFLQQMGVDIRQERGLHYDILYKPNGQPHQLTEGVEVISVVDAGVFAVGANVTPLVISEFNQVIAAVAKINTNPYQSLQIGIASPRDGETYDRNQLPPLTGFIEQADSSAGKPVITATIRSSATRLPEILDVTDCWLTGCVLPSANLADENVIDVVAVTPAGFSARASVRFSVQSIFDFTITSPIASAELSTESEIPQARINAVNFAESMRVVARLNGSTVSTSTQTEAAFDLPLPLNLLRANSANTLEVDVTSGGQSVTKSVVFATKGAGGTLEEGADVVVFNDSNAFLTSYTQNVPIFENLLIFGNNQFKSERNLVAFDNRVGDACSTEQQCGQALNTLTGIARQNEMRLVNYTGQRGFYENISPSFRVIVVWGMINGFTSAEVNALRAFVLEGGRVVFVGDHPGATTLVNPNTSNNVYAQLGISVRNITFNGATNNETLLPNPLASHPVLSGVKEVYIGGGGATTYGEAALPLLIADRGPVVIVAKILD